MIPFFKFENHQGQTEFVRTDCVLRVRPCNSAPRLVPADEPPHCLIYVTGPDEWVEVRGSAEDVAGLLHQYFLIELDDESEEESDDQ